jgi:hypothetical protein
MQVFLSYREDEEGIEYASALREELAILGINAIMASRSIRPGAVWAQTILGHLEASSALLCIASRGYTDSAWCQQEIGWAIGRGIPALWIRYDNTEQSVGFLKDKQELTATNPVNEAEIARAVGAWLVREQKTQEEARGTFIRAFTGSSTYQQTWDIARVLATLESLTDDEWQQINKAAATNRQVREAHSYPERDSARSVIPVTDWLHRQLNKSADNTWPWILPVSVLQRRGGGRALRRGPHV